MKPILPVSEGGVPRWLELQAEADYWAWVIETMYEKAGERSPLDLMVDDATGYSGVMLKEAQYAMKQFKRCKAALTKPEGV